MRVISSLENSLQPVRVALGNFDGVHLGHRAVIGALSASPAAQASWDVPQSEVALIRTESWTSESREVESRTVEAPTAQMVASSPLYTTVVSFDPHPQAYFSGQPRTCLTVLEEKVEVLQALGVEQLVLLPFNQALSALTPEAFVEQILVQQLQAKKISVGFNFHFGYRRTGTAEMLKEIAARFDIPVFIVAPQALNGEQVSSSKIRQALAAGEVMQANRLLGRPYPLTGEVVKGQQIGRTIGFPTANLKVSDQKFIPRHGVYRVWVKGEAFGQPQLGVMNIGNRPTIAGQSVTIEVHLLDWSQDIYGHTVTVHLEQFLRPEQKFESLDALKARIQQDCATARSL